MIKRLVVVGLLLAGVSMSGLGAVTAAAPQSPNGLVINEVYAPNGTFSNQYFELYNNSNVTLDLSNYDIYNSNGSNHLNTLPSAYQQIGAHQWLAIGATLFPTRTIGSGLNTAADFLALVPHGSEDTPIDVVNWGTPDPNWNNYGTFQNFFFPDTPPTMPTDTAMSMQRYPNGHDTDRGADWVGLPRTPSHTPPTYTPTATPSPSATATGIAGASATPTATPTPFCRDSHEPDNGPDTAKSLVLGTEQTDHTICPNGDEDWFVITVTDNKVYTLYTRELTGGLDTIMAVYTYPYDGTKIAENDDQASPACLCSRIDYAFPASGNYYVRVRDNRQLGGSGWTYIVGFTANPGPAPTSTPSFTPTPNPNAPTATPTSAACLDVYEPDGVPETAHLLLIDNKGDMIETHTMCPGGDADWYRFFAGRGKAYTISTMNLSRGVDTYLYLFDSDGKTVMAENDDITGSPPSGNPNDVVSSSIQFFPIRDDFYYIFIKNKGALGAPFMTYDINMKVQSNVPPPAGTPTPIIAPIVTVTFPPTAAPPTEVPTAPSAATDTPMPLPTAPPTTEPNPLPTETPTETPTPPPSGALATSTPPPAEDTPTPIANVGGLQAPPPAATEPPPEELPTVAPIVPLPATGHTPDRALMLSMPLSVYMDHNSNRLFSPGEGVYGLRLVFMDTDGTPFASATTDRLGAAHALLPRGTRTTVAIPYLHWTGSVQASLNGFLVRLPKVALPARIP